MCSILFYNFEYKSPPYFKLSTCLYFDVHYNILTGKKNMYFNVVCVNLPK